MTTTMTAPPVSETYLLSVDQYHRMIDDGILTKYDRVELIDGRILRQRAFRDGEPERYRFSAEQLRRTVEAGILTPDEAGNVPEGENSPDMTRKPPHDCALDQLEDVFRPLIPPGWRPRTQKAVTLPSGEPEPDLAIVIGPAGRYADHHPGPGEIALVAEVADASLGFDRGRKLVAYARAGIPVYWIVNIPDRRIEVYTGPTAPADGGDPHYAARTDYAPGQDVPVVVAGQAVGVVAVAAVLP